MKNLRTAAVLGAAALAIATTAAYGQATRTFVSGVGDDLNPCSRTAPCKTFAGAISKTAANGEINCLDPAGYGAVTITKSITIDCTGTFGSILNSGTTGIIMNDSATGTPNTIDVIIRGISIDGAGATAGLRGIRFVSGRSLVVEDVVIMNQNGSGGDGIQINSGGAAEVHLNNVLVTDSVNGIQIQQTGAGGSARVEITNSRFRNNSSNGFRIDTTGNVNPAGINVTIDQSSFTGNANGVVVNGPAGTSNAQVLLANSTVSNNSTTGILGSGTLARIRVGNTSISGNNTGVSAGGGSNVNTYGNNRLNGNIAADGAFTLPAIGQQ